MDGGVDDPWSSQLWLVRTNKLCSTADLGFALKLDEDPLAHCGVQMFSAWLWSGVMKRCGLIYKAEADTWIIS